MKLTRGEIMRVEKFTKTKNGMYKLSLENGQEVLAHEELILNKNILLTREIYDSDLANIDQLNNNYNAYDLAIKYISKRNRSCYEVYEYLLEKDVDRIVVSEVVARLKKQKYLDDAVYAKAFINDRIKFSNNGPYKIKKELEERHIADSIIEETLSVFDSKLETERLNKLVPKYVNTIHNKSYVMMIKKVNDYFASLGYHQNIVGSILRNVDYDDSKSREKEYNKLKKKFASKYSGSELESKIKQIMYNHGYR